MNEFLRHLGLFCGIIAFFSGIVVITMNRILCAKKENRFYRLLRRYHLAFFAYILVIFAFYYVMEFVTDEPAVLAISVIGNITLAYLCVVYARIIGFLNERENSIGYRIVVAVNVIYVLGWIGIDVFIRHSILDYITSSIGRVSVWVLELLVFASLAFFVAEQLKNHKKDKWLYFFLFVFSIEYIWEIMYDLGIGEPFFLFTHATRPFNIILIVYLIANVVMIAGGYWKALMEKEEQQEKIQEESSVMEDVEAEESIDPMEEKMQKYALTGREREILQLVLDGKSNQEIAELLFISDNTVKHHITNIYKKTEVSRRMQVVSLFQEEK